MKVSLVVPIYNESQHLEIFLKELDALEFAVDKELIFVVLKNINLESDRFGFEPEITAKNCSPKSPRGGVPVNEHFPATSNAESGNAEQALATNLVEVCSIAAVY